MNRLLDAALLLALWWLLGLLLWGLWFATVGNAEIPERLRDDLPNDPESAFAGGAACFGVGVGKAARRLTT